jgi:hypothetical protein
MLINVKVRSKTITISVGDGSQNFRWLAMVITGRLKEYHVLRSTFEEDYGLVVSLKDNEGRLLNPVDPICDVLTNNATIYAELAESVPSDEYGNPLLSEWRIAAFVRSSHGIKWNNEMEAYREQQAKAKKVEDVQSNELVFVGSFTANEIDAAFDLDWRQMDWEWLGFSAVDDEVLDLKKILRANYGVICKVYSHYSGVAKGIIHVLVHTYN